MGKNFGEDQISILQTLGSISAPCQKFNNDFEY